MIQYDKWYTSSSGDGFSLTLKGVVTSLVPIVIWIAGHYNIPITDNEIIELINQAFVAASGFMILYGLGRKIYYKFNK